MCKRGHVQCGAGPCISDLESSGGDNNTKDGTESPPDSNLMQTDLYVRNARAFRARAAAMAAGALETKS